MSCFFGFTLLFFCFCSSTTPLIFILLLTSRSFCLLRLTASRSFCSSCLTVLSFREFMKPIRFNFLLLPLLLFLSCLSLLPESSLVLDVASLSCFFGLTSSFLLRLTACHSFGLLNHSP